MHTNYFCLRPLKRTELVPDDDLKNEVASVIKTYCNYKIWGLNRNEQLQYINSMDICPDEQPEVLEILKITLSPD